MPAVLSGEALTMRFPLTIEHLSRRKRLISLATEHTACPRAAILSEDI
jgi:hypothetical protein